MGRVSGLGAAGNRGSSGGSGAAATIALSRLTLFPLPADWGPQLSGYARPRLNFILPHLVGIGLLQRTTATMSLQNFERKEYQTPACHIREYPGSTVGQEDVLHLHVKQYTPRNQPSVLPMCAVTLVAAHANAYPKVRDMSSKDLSGLL